MSDGEAVRLELSFEGGQLIAVEVSPTAADEVERAIADGAPDALRLATEDGTISIAVTKLAYVKRYGRDARVGF